MRTVTFNLPENLDMDDWEISMSLASKLYEDSELSLGQAADLAGLTKRTFAKLLGKYGVSIFDYPASDLSQDIASA